MLLTCDSSKTKLEFLA